MPTVPTLGATNARWPVKHAAMRVVNNIFMVDGIGGIVLVLGDANAMILWYVGGTASPASRYSPGT